MFDPKIKKDNWSRIWHLKGLQEGDSKFLNGWEDTPMNGKKVVDNIKKIIHMKSGERVLEVGCGAGYLG